MEGLADNIIRAYKKNIIIFKYILGWLGDRTTAPSLLVRALYRCLVDTERGGGGSISQPT